jgi:hypothetical protein
MIFARGAVRAALWARGQKPGLYSMATCSAALWLKGFGDRDDDRSGSRAGASWRERLEFKNLFTGWKELIHRERHCRGRAAGRKLMAQDISFDVGFTSALIRAQRRLTSFSRRWVTNPGFPRQGTQ